MESSNNISNKEIKIFHPLVFIIFEIFNIYLTVIETASLNYIIRPLIVLVMFVFFVYRLLVWILKNKYKSGIITTTTVIFIFSFFYFFEFTRKIIKIPGIVFIIFWILLYFAIIYIVFKFTKSLIKINKILNFLSLVVLFIPLCLTIFLEFKMMNIDTSGVLNNQWVKEKGQNNINKNLPDIYYIILDSYSSQNGLKYIFKYDNKPFIDFLKKNGFFIADNSFSNYNLTYCSLASSLNADYINNLTSIVGEDSKNNRLFIRLIQNNRVANFLKKRGYKTFTFDSTYTGTYLNGVEKKKRPFFCFSEFETIIFKVSIFSFISNNILYKSHYNFINYTLNNLANLDDTDSPKFVFAHILSPHPPFVFEADGKFKSLEYPFNFLDGYYFYSPKKTYKMYLEGYKSQVQYLNKKLRTIITKILKKSKVPPIIILQADHGSGSSYHPGDIKKTNLLERFSILNAYLLPEKGKQLLYRGISPVNTFRVILNHLFNTKLPLLNDLSFFSTWMKFYKFIPVKLR